jgi:hypothetical protein
MASDKVKGTYFIQADTQEEAQAEAMMKFAQEHPEVDFESLQVVATEFVKEES